VAKLEHMNPGGSVKDRIALPMIEAAERAGLLKPGGVIVEPTSGNTGVGLAQVAAVKGYRCIFVMADKQSEEKRALLRAYGAEVVVCPSDVDPEDERSYYRVSDRLARETPGAWKPDQYSNAANPEAHYATTGPEIWEATEGRLTHFVASIGTGGTISGAGHYLKQRKPALVIVGADPEGSVFSGDTPRPYLTEGIGEDFWPTTYDTEICDQIVRVSDRDSMLTARAATAREGILMGESGGTVLWAALQVARDLDDPDALFVVVLPDSGRNYVGKLYRDEWLRECGLIGADEEVAAYDWRATHLGVVVRR
jgi:cystathionine beta-synthase